MAKKDSLDETIVPRPTPEIDDAAGTPQSVIHRRRLPEIIGDGIAACMYQREQHRRVENEIDQWFRDLPVNKAERNDMVDEARKQMETARMAMELFHIRVRQLAVSAKVI